MSHFGQVFLDAVVEPWHEACTSAAYPWMATPELRQEWFKGMRSGDDLTSMSSAIGLARCARLNPAEMDSVHRYFARTPDDIIPDEVILDLLLTGASPPGILAYTAFKPLLDEDLSPFPSYWTYLADFIRHPASYQFASAVLQHPEMPSIILYNACANPLTYVEPEKMPTGLNEGEAHWFNAIGKMKGFYTEAFAPVSDLDFLAHLLDCSKGQDDMIHFHRKNLLPPHLLPLRQDHPCLHKDACPDHDPRNPSRKVIEYFASPGSISALHRFYNPLLNYPWLEEDITETADGVELLGLLLLGYCPSHFHHMLRNDANLFPWVEKHPSWNLSLLQGAFAELAD